MKTFGLTGGIACGKSTVNKTFNSLGIPMVDADIVARQVVEVETPGWEQLRKVFGIEYFHEDQTLNRTKLAGLVFTDPSSRSELNRIMLPLIDDEATIQIKKLHDDGHQIVGYDAALLIEMGHADKYRPLVVVICTPEIQLERLMRRNRLSEEEAMARINAQLPTSAKTELADFIIETSGTIKNSVLQTEEVLYEIKQLNLLKT
jgi:dephospho-CoA kinase